MFARFINSLPNGVSQRITQFYFQGTSLTKVNNINTNLANFKLQTMSTPRYKATTSKNKVTQVLKRTKRNSHSYTEQHNYPNMDVKILPALTDNYMYLIVDKATKEAAVVDPVEPNRVLQAVQQLNANLTTVLTTHHHWDHAGGNEALKQQLPHLKVYGGDQRINAMTDAVKHGDSIKVGNLLVDCLFTPCHTSGHICYYVHTPEDSCDRAVFTGDTLFLGGCGRFFEGTAEQMYRALCETLSNLPEETKVFCGHEYTLQNLKFASFVEPFNDEVLKKLQWSMARRSNGLPTVSSDTDRMK